MRVLTVVLLDGSVRRRPVGLLWLGAALGLAGVALIVGSVLVLARDDVPTPRADLVVPGSRAFDLEPGPYVVWLTAGDTAPEAEVTVTGPGGQPVPVRRPDENRSFVDDGRRFAGRAEFDVRAAGRHTVAVASDEAVAARVTPPLADGPLVTGVGALAAGVAVTALGAAVLAVGALARARARRRPR